MTLEQLADSLPNGFHDAEIERFVWNYQTNSASFAMTLWVPEETDDSPEIYRAGRLDVKDIVFISIDPPCPVDFGSRPYTSRAETLSIDGVTPSEDMFPGLAALRQKMPRETAIYSFYVNNWNSYIHIAAKEAHLTWLRDREVKEKKNFPQT